jgi:hypothetical protein
LQKDGNDELVITTPEGQVFIIDCYGELMCLELGEPVKFFHIGNYSTELISLNLAETSALSEVDLHQGHLNSANTGNPAFERAIDPSASSRALGNEDYSASNNPLCFIYVSALTNRICLMQVDIILNMYKLRSPETSKLNYKCENVFSLKKKLNPKLSQLLYENKELSGRILSEILNSNYLA